MTERSFRDQFFAEGKRQSAPIAKEKEAMKDDMGLSTLFTEYKGTAALVGAALVGAGAYAVRKKLQRSEQNQANIELVHEAKIRLRDDDRAPNVQHGQMMATLYPPLRPEQRAAAASAPAPGAHVNATESEKDVLISKYYKACMDRENTITALQTEVVRLGHGLDEYEQQMKQMEDRHKAEVEELKKQHLISLQLLQTQANEQRALVTATQNALDLSDQKIKELQNQAMTPQTTATKTALKSALKSQTAQEEKRDDDDDEDEGDDDDDDDDDKQDQDDDESEEEEDEDAKEDEKKAKPEEKKQVFTDIHTIPSVDTAIKSVVPISTLSQTPLSSAPTLPLATTTTTQEAERQAKDLVPSFFAV